jgi:hypothetical protein
VLAALAAAALLASSGRPEPVVGRPAPSPFPDPTPAVARALAQAPAGGPRAARATRPLHGAPYLASALGEGAGPDADPRFRLDAFDCLGFVETAVALGSARNLDEARRALDDIRYAGPPRLAARHHEVLSQWIPAALARGWIAELTPALAGPRLVREVERYDAARWDRVRRAGRAIAGLPRRRLPVGEFALAYVAPPDAVALAGAVPDGSLVFPVRAPDPSRATRITHAGLVFVAPDGSRWVRHATSTRGVARVVEEPFPAFARRQERSRPGWPVAGYAFYAVPDASARVLALARPPVARASAPPSLSPPAPRL